MLRTPAPLIGALGVTADKEYPPMPRIKTESEVAAGLLISAIQKVWGTLLDTDEADYAEAVMNRSHDLLQATATGDLTKLLAGQTTAEHLDEIWVAQFPKVVVAAKTLDAAHDEA